MAIGKHIFLASLFLLSACAANKGSFALNDVEPPQLESEIKPQYQDDNSNKRGESSVTTHSQMEPALGFEMQIPLADRSGHEGALIEPKNIVMINDGTLSIPHLKDEKMTEYGEDLIFHSHDGKLLMTQRDMQFVRSGFVVRDGYRSGSKYKPSYHVGVYGFIYYKGIMPATSFVHDKTVRYEGAWDFATDRNNSGKFHKDTVSGRTVAQSFGAFSLVDNVNGRNNNNTADKKLDTVVYLM